MDEQLRRLHELAKASPNFGMLYGHEPLLALYGSQSELNVFTNPNAASVSARQFGEVLAEELVRRTGLRVTGTRQIDRLRALTSIGALTAPCARRSTRSAEAATRPCTLTSSTRPPPSPTSGSAGTWVSSSTAR